MEEKKEAPKKEEKKIPEKVVKKEKTVEIMFRENRKFDLHVGRDMITFLGRKTKSVPAAWLNHKDFKQVQKLFVIKGA